MVIRARLATIVAVLVALAGLTFGNGWSPRWASGMGPKPRPAPRTAVIVLENRESGEVLGNAEAPFLNRLAQRGALATSYYAVSHPSLPNYLAMIGGSTFGIHDDCTDCRAAGDNLAVQLSRAGLSWRAYMEGMPEACYTGPAYGDYVKRHDPFMYFGSIASVPGRCENVVPATQLDEDLRRGSLPTFSWISPNLCNDAHSCSLSSADRFLANLVPRLLPKLGPGGILLVTFDEGTSDMGCCRGSTGGHVVTLFVGPGARRGARLSSPFDHYSLLATIEARYGLPRIRDARSAPIMYVGIRRGQPPG